MPRQSDSSSERRQAAEQAVGEALGRTIEVMRTERGLKRTELAELSGISYSYLSDIEKGRKPPSSTKLREIAEALEVSPSQLLRGAAERIEAERSGGGGFLDEEFAPEWLKYADDISPSLRHYWERMRLEDRAAGRLPQESRRSAPFESSSDEVPDWVKRSPGYEQRGRDAAYEPPPARHRPAPYEASRQEAMREENDSFDSLLAELTVLMRRMPVEDVLRLLDLARRLAR